MLCWVSVGVGSCLSLHLISVTSVVIVPFLSFAFSPPFVKVVRVVAEVDLRVDLRELEVRVSLEELVRIQLYKFGKGEGTLNVLVDIGGVDRVVRTFIHRV